MRLEGSPPSPNANFPLQQFGARRHQADRARPPAINQQSERGGPVEATLRTGPFREAGVTQRPALANTGLGCQVEVFEASRQLQPI